MERCNLSAVSAGSLSSGPSFTYLSGDVQTTVDYIHADVEATSLMSDCRILPMDDLNTSYHLPLACGHDVCTLSGKAYGVCSVSED